MEEKKMNILVIGASGSGKSTLIGAVSGAKIVTGVGEGQTQKIAVYESDTWPLRFIDTKGFEYSLREQIKTIRQIKKFSKGQIKIGDTNGIDAIWYCIDGTSGRVFLQNINLMSKAIKGWKDIPIFAVITKSLVESDMKANIEAVQSAFAKSKSMNLKKIIPVVAQEYQVNEDTLVAPFGITELCMETLNCYDEAKSISRTNRNRMILEQKRYTAYSITGGLSGVAGAVGAIPIPFPDAVILTPIEVSEVKAILKVYGIDTSNDLIDAIVGSSIITGVAKTIVHAIPIVGPVINGVVATVMVYAIGQGTILACEEVYNGNIDPAQIKEFTDKVASVVKNSKIITKTIDYINNNKDKIKDKNVKDIAGEILKSVK